MLSPFSRVTPFKPGVVRSLGGVSDEGLLFQAFAGESSLANLSQELSINNNTLTPTYRYEGKNASASGWTATVGTDLVLASSGTDPTYQELTPLTGSTDKAVKFAAGKTFQAASTSTYDLSADTTSDLIWEAVFQVPFDFSQVVIYGKYTGADLGPLLLVEATTGLLKHYGTVVMTMGSLTAGAWYHVLVMTDRNSNTRCYLNGSLSGTPTASSVAEMSNTMPFEIGGYANATNKGNGRIALVQHWRAAAGTINTTAEQDSIAKERFARLIGMYAQRASGTATPSTLTRTTSAYLDRVIDESTGERRLFLAGSNWLRLGKRKEVSGGEYLTGVLSEPLAVNMCLQSEDFSTTWTGLNIASISTNAIAAPNGETRADGLVADATNGAHYVTQSITLTAISYTFSVWAKKGNQNYVGLYVDGLNGVMFDLVNGTVGNRFAAVANITGAIEDWGNGWYRCLVTYTGTAAGYLHRIYASDQDWAANGSNTESFAGDDVTVNAYLWGAQVQNAQQTKSYIPTTTASAQRNADNLQYNAVGNVPLSGTMVAKSLLPANSASNQWIFVGAGSPGGTPEAVYIGSANGGATAQGVTTTGSSVTANIQAGANQRTGEIVETRLVYQTDDVRLYVDGALAGTDTSAAMPTSFSSLSVGGLNASFQPHGLVSDVRIYNKEKVS